MGEALRRVHAVPLEACPFDAGMDAMLATARRNVRRRWVDEGDFDGRRRGRSAEDVLAEAIRTRPPDGARVFVHGDPYPQNVLVAGDGLGGLVDWGSAGAGDPWRDLALATFLFEERAGAEVASEVLAAYGVPASDRSRVPWWRLMDELC